MNTSTFIGQVGKFKVLTRKMKLTAQAGVVLLNDFVGQKGFAELIDEHISVKERERGYAESENILALCWNMILGGSSLRDLDVLRGDSGLRDLLGVESLMAPTTAGEFLRSFSIGDISLLQKVLRECAMKMRPSQQAQQVTIDIDASMYRQCSLQKQGSRMNYKGEVGYYPLFAFWAETQELLFSHLLAGNRRAVKKIEWFMEQVLKVVPDDKPIYLRADSEFYQWKLIDWCEERGVIYAITADQTKQLKKLIENLPESRWKRFDEAMDIAELEYAPHRHASHRYIVKRCLESNRAGQESWSYHAIITNDEKRKAKQVLKWFYKKCAMENQIKEHKNEFGLEKMPSQQFHANWTWLLIGQLAWNLMAWFKRECLPEENHSQTIRTIRHRILKVAGKVVKHARQDYLILPEDYLFKDTWCFAIKKLAQLKEISP